MNTPTRDFLRRPDAPRRRSVRQALAVIPNMTTSSMSPGEAISLVSNNLANSRYEADSWSPAPSPDELVIQKRGRRRRTIVWSPDIDACKRDSLFSLSSRDCTPVKNPNKSNLILRSTPRKRLLLGGGDESQLITPEKRKTTSESPESTQSNSPQKRFMGSLANGLRGLSHEQLIKLIMDVISMQEDGVLPAGEKFRDILLKKMPIADIQPLRERLSNLRQNIYCTLVSSEANDSAYSRAYVHLDAFQKTLMDQGARLMDSQHWTAVMQYVFSAWSITKDLPEWENQGLDNTTRKCFKALASYCMHALQNGAFVSTTLDAYAAKLETMVADCSDLNICLQLIKKTKTSMEKNLTNL